MKQRELIREIRRALADYIVSEGCSCCQDTPTHNEAANRLAKLLRVPKYADGSGFNFYACRSGDMTVEIRPARKAKAKRRSRSSGGSA